MGYNECLKLNYDNNATYPNVSLVFNWSIIFLHSFYLVNELPDPDPFLATIVTYYWTSLK